MSPLVAAMTRRCELQAERSAKIEELRGIVGRTATDAVHGALDRLARRIKGEYWRYANGSGRLPRRWVLRGQAARQRRFELLAIPVGERSAGWQSDFDSESRQLAQARARTGFLFDLQGDEFDSALKLALDGREFGSPPPWDPGHSTQRVLRSLLHVPDQMGLAHRFDVEFSLECALFALEALSDEPEDHRISGWVRDTESKGLRGRYEEESPLKGLLYGVSVRSVLGFVQPYEFADLDSSARGVGGTPGEVSSRHGDAIDERLIALADAALAGLQLAGPEDAAASECVTEPESKVIVGESASASSCAQPTGRDLDEAEPTAPSATPACVDPDMDELVRAGVGALVAAIVDLTHAVQSMPASPNQHDNGRSPHHVAPTPRIKARRKRKRIRREKATLPEDVALPVAQVESEQNRCNMEGPSVRVNDPTDVIKSRLGPLQCQKVLRAFEVVSAYPDETVGVAVTNDAGIPRRTLVEGLQKVGHGDAILSVPNEKGIYRKADVLAFIELRWTPRR